VAKDVGPSNKQLPSFATSRAQSGLIFPLIPSGLKVATRRERSPRRVETDTTLSASHLSSLLGTVKREATAAAAAAAAGVATAAASAAAVAVAGSWSAAFLSGFDMQIA